MSLATAPAWAPARPLRLTRRAMAAWPRWREATGLGRRMAAAGLHRDEVAALERLAANLASAPEDQAGWFRFAGNGLRLQPETAEALLRGLECDPRAVPDLVRALQPANGHRAAALETALRKRFPLPEAPPPGPPVFYDECLRINSLHASGAGARARDRAAEAREQGLTPSPSPPPPPPRSLPPTPDPIPTERTPEMMNTTPTTKTPSAANGSRPEPLRPRLARLLAERGIDLAEEHPAARKEELATALGTTAGNIAMLMADLRREAGIVLPRGGDRWTRCKEARATTASQEPEQADLSPPPDPSPELADLVEQLRMQHQSLVKELDQAYEEQTRLRENRDHLFRKLQESEARPDAPPVPAPSPETAETSDDIRWAAVEVLSGRASDLDGMTMAGHSRVLALAAHLALVAAEWGVTHGVSPHSAACRSGSRGRA